ncbi:uncharacterized protein RSE6_13587 [Rhynchosporium secalis]|uniref:Uncharacterized protein n=1 Tax=Rhynchosporium secalis TaxID=38038 RepID=A0A1E1MT74_RHYSE|nr:uncharacterized protein RSE6_13587 [Rhynchosporium secalis]
MHLSHLSFFALPLLVASTPTGTNPNSFFYKSLTLTFSGGPASYTLTFPADGSTYSTNNNLSINRIASSDFNIFYNCNFYFADDGGKAVVTKPGADNKEIQVGSPRAVTGPTASGAVVQMVRVDAIL